MFKLDDNFLQELGLGGLPADDKKAMLNHIYETLEMRVGMKLAEQMTNEQLDEFEGFINRNDEPGALNWLETNFPNYKQVVADELEKLKNEIKAAAPQILATALGPQQVAPQQPPMQPAPQQPQPMAQMPQQQYQPQPVPGAAYPQAQQPLPQPQYPPAQQYQYPPQHLVQQQYPPMQQPAAPQYPPVPPQQPGQ